VKTDWTFFNKFAIVKKVTPNEISKLIISDVENPGRVAAVFDLDSTLFCVSPRSQAIVRELTSEAWFRRDFPEASEILSKLKIAPNEYGIKTALLSSGLEPSKPLLETVRNYWRSRFFSNSHMRHDLMYPGAEQFVNRLHAGGVDIFYLTGRSEALQREGTLLNLKSWKFPDLPLDRIMMKPTEMQTDEKYKEIRLRELVPRYSRTWFFENEPVIIHQVRNSLPEVRIVFIDSTHSGKANPPKDLLTVRMDFR
jgi:hypothetical protein